MHVNMNTGIVQVLPTMSWNVVPGPSDSRLSKVIAYVEQRLPTQSIGARSVRSLGDPFAPPVQEAETHDGSNVSIPEPPSRPRESRLHPLIRPILRPMRLPDTSEVSLGMNLVISISAVSLDRQRSGG